MAQSLANIGNVSDNWKKYVLIWILTVLGVSLATSLGFWGTLFGTVGLTFGFWGVRSLWRAVAARSVEQVAVGSLGGRHEAVELEGRARPVDEPLTAPLSGEECIAYLVEVSEDRTYPGD
jgi:hypothetical protein